MVELARGTSALGLGLAGGVPGMVLAELGATVVRVVDDRPGTIDAHVAWGRVWHRHKQIVTTDDPGQIRDLLRTADVVIAYGAEAIVERQGLGFHDASALNPSLVYARCRPSRTGKGTVDDYALLVEANAGFCTQLAGHRPGPIFVDARAAGAGTAFVLTAGVLALLRRREETGQGGWCDTSLYDGLIATLGAMIGRSERAAPEIEGYWEKGSTFPNFLYTCADGELLQVWFGGKGMYAALIEVLGDEPSENGYYSDQVTGALNERAVRWRSFFAKHPRDYWIARLRPAGVACEPVLAPGDALLDPHVAEIGLALAASDGAHHDIVVASPIRVSRFDDDAPGAGHQPADGEESTSVTGARLPATGSRDDHGLGSRRADHLLAGVRVVDFSAFVAGPLAAQVLADMGADVIKVEPPEGEAMRAAAYAVAACQRGKRSLALDVRAPEAREVVERLIRRADVVLHNFRVGVAERLGIDEKAVARLNPQAVYCHASAFGTTGPRSTLPGNDALMQAVTGLERAVGGAGNAPIAPTWIPIDMCGGWVSAVGILAGLYVRAARARGQCVLTSLLGTGMLLQSGVFLRDGEPVREPELDAQQTGYGPGYRIYQGADGNWFALVVPDRDAWVRLRTVPEAASLPETYAPLRSGPHCGVAQEAETILEGAFATAPAAAWVTRLRGVGLLAEGIDAMDRDRFRQEMLDDPINRQLGRVAAYETAEWGHFEQIGSLIRYGPASGGLPPQMLPGIGEHTVGVLAELGFTEAEIDELLAAKVARQL